MPTLRTTLLAFLLLLLVVTGPGPALGQDPAAETPEEKKTRLLQMKGEVEKALPGLVSRDTVERGNALEVIAEKGREIREIEVPGLVEAVRTAGLTAEERFMAVQAGEILNHLDPEGTVDWLDQKVFGVRTKVRTKRNGLAIVSEIRDERSGKMAAVLATAGNSETRVHAIWALAKLRLPGTYGALASALGAQDQDVKDNAAIALGRLGDVRAIMPLLAHLQDASGNHPAFAAWALKQFDDDRIFSAAAGNLGSDSGEPGDAKARIIEDCAKPQHINRLMEILKGSRSTKYRIAAARAVGRLAKNNEGAQRTLLTGINKDKDERVRWACFFGLSKNLGQALAGDIVKALKRYSGARNTDQHHRFRMFAFLAGDLKSPDAAPFLLKAAMLHKEDKNGLTWRIAAVNFWRCAGPPDGHESRQQAKDAARWVRKLKDDFDNGKDDRLIARMAEIIGRSHRQEEFEFLIKQFRRFPEWSANAIAVEKAVEHMTGHFFGASFGIWQHWFRKNPDIFKPRVYRIDRRKWAQEFGRKDREFRQTEATERAVQLGLAWIARHQNLQGALNPNKFFERCTHEPSCVKEGSRHMIDPVGPSALATMALLGAGYSPERGKYKDTLRRYLEYLEVRQTADGNFRTTDMFQGYGRPMSMYAFSEAYNITGNDRYRPYLRRGIDYFVEIQNELGGWHYKPDARVTDTSVMSWVLLGLGVAHKSGFEVREAIFEGCDMILDKYSKAVQSEREVFQDIDPHYAYDVGTRFNGTYETGYQAKVSENATTSFGLVARMFLGWRRSHPFCIGSGNFNLKNNMERIPKAENWDKYVSRNRFPSYAWYYGTLAMHQMGGRYFREWNRVIKDLLPGIQLKRGCDAGAWKVYNYDFVGGKAYTTCMGVLTLETYYRYKPFCEEGLPPEDGDDD